MQRNTLKPESKVKIDLLEDGVWLANHECFRASFLTGLLEELEKMGVELRFDNVFYGLPACG